MPDHADSLDDALNISLDRAGRVDLELIARLADTTVDEAEASLGDRIIRNPDTGTVMPAEDYLTGDVGTKLDRVTAMADRLKRRAGTEAMTRVRGSHLRDAGGHARHGAGRRMDRAPRERTCGAASRTRTPPNPTGIQRRSSNASTAGTHGPWAGTATRNLSSPSPGGLWRNFPNSHTRVTLERSDTGERKPWHAPAWHQSHGTSPLWDALCWTWRDGDAPQNYAPILADRDMPVRDLALLRPQDRPHRPARHRRQDRDPLQPVRKLARRRRERPARLDGHDHRRDGTPAHARHRPIPRGSPNGSPPTCPSANGSGASPANCQTDCARRGSTTPTASRHAPSTRAPTTTGSSKRAARSSSDNGVSSRSTPRPRTPTRRTRNGSNTWPACWNACSPPHWRPSRSRRRWEPRGSPPGTSTTS